MTGTKTVPPVGLEGFIEASLQEQMDGSCPSEFDEQPHEITRWDVAAEVWDVVVALEDDARLCLKERHRALKKKLLNKKKKEKRKGSCRGAHKGRFGVNVRSWSPSDASSDSYDSSCLSEDTRLQDARQRARWHNDLRITPVHLTRPRTHPELHPSFG